MVAPSDSKALSMQPNWQPFTNTKSHSVSEWCAWMFFRPPTPVQLPLVAAATLALSKISPSPIQLHSLLLVLSRESPILFVLAYLSLCEVVLGYLRWACGTTLRLLQTARLPRNLRSSLRPQMEHFPRPQPLQSLTTSRAGSRWCGLQASLPTGLLPRTFCSMHGFIGSQEVSILDIVELTSIPKSMTCSSRPISTARMARLIKSRLLILHSTLRG